MSTAALVLADGFGMHDGDIGWGWMVVMMLGMFVFWGAVIFGVVWLIRGGVSSSSTGGDAEEILARRLAEGAISVEEYEERRAALRGGHDRPGLGDRPAEEGT
jgi:putative membrane protein